MSLSAFRRRRSNRSALAVLDERGIGSPERMEAGPTVSAAVAGMGPAIAECARDGYH